LKRRRLQGGEGLAGGFWRVGRFRRGGGDLPRQVEKIGHRDPFHQGEHHGEGLEHFHQPRAQDEDHEGMAAAHAQKVRDRSADAVVRPRGQQHHVVGAGGDRGHEGKADEGGEKLSIHLAIMAAYHRNRVANIG